MRRFRPAQRRLIAAALACAAWPSILANAQLWNLAKTSVAIGVPESVFDNSGSPWPLDTTIPATNYDLGGQGIAYNSGAPACANTGVGSSYRTDAVNFKTSADGPPYQLACDNSGNWYKYTINIAQAGPYVLTLRAANAINNGTWTLLLDVVSIGTLKVPNIGSYSAFSALQSSQLNAALGNHVIELLAGNSDRGAGVGEISSFVVGVASTGGAGCPPSGWAGCALLGTYQAYNLSNFNTVVGRQPDYVIDQTFTLPGGVGSDPGINNPYPVITIVQLFGGTCPYGTSYAASTNAVVIQPMRQLMLKLSNMLLTYTRCARTRSPASAVDGQARIL